MRTGGGVTRRLLKLVDAAPCSPPPQPPLRQSRKLGRLMERTCNAVRVAHGKVYTHWQPARGPVSVSITLSLEQMAANVPKHAIRLVRLRNISFTLTLMQVKPLPRWPQPHEPRPQHAIVSSATIGDAIQEAAPPNVSCAAQHQTMQTIAPEPTLTGGVATRPTLKHAIVARF
jgi:hypothetical protein